MDDAYDQIEELQDKLDACEAKLNSTYGKQKTSLFMDSINKLKKSSSTNKLVEALGQKGQRFSQDIVELGLSLMTSRISSEQAVEMIRIFVAFESPDLKEGADYRIPDAPRFRRWRRFLLPISHYIGVSVVKMANISHLMHDATTKHGIHYLHTCMRVELEVKGELVVVDVPITMDICKSGKANSEAADIKAALSSPVNGGVTASFVSVVSGTSDNAARATTREVNDLKCKELENLRRDLSEEDMLELGGTEFVKEMKAAAEAYRKLTPHQQSQATIIHELGCSGHSLDLTIDACYNKTEKNTLKENMAREEYDGEPRDVGNIIRVISKLFASGGEHSNYYLNEFRVFENYTKKVPQSVYTKLPPVRGSRQSINVELPAAIVFNTESYLHYLSGLRVDSEPNKLVTEAVDGLSDRFVQGALRARTLVNCDGTSYAVFHRTFK